MCETFLAEVCPLPVFWPAAPPALSLEYGETRQLQGTLDVLTRLLLATPTTLDDRAALCAAFTAKAEALPAAAANSGATVLASVDRPKRAMPAPTVERFPRRLTIGMATYDDYDGAYFTIQSIRVNNPELEGALEFVVIDNNPGGPCSEALRHLGKSIEGYRYVPCDEWTGTAIRNAIFEESSSPIVLCIDSHVLIVPGALSKLISYFESNPESRDLVQGPLVYDDLRNKSTHMEPRWRAGMYGTWAMIRAVTIRQQLASPSPCTVWAFSHAAAWLGPASIQSSGDLAAKKVTSTKKCGSVEDEPCVYPFYDGCIDLTVPWVALCEPMGRSHAQLCHWVHGAGIGHRGNGGPFRRAAWRRDISQNFHRDKNGARDT